MNNDLKELQKKLCEHPVYSALNSLDRIKTFMQCHVFAVWDFMSLLKALQRQVSCIEVPWKPSSYPTELVRLINEIVVAEESDVDPEGQYISHFELYLRAMKEVNAETEAIKSYLKNYDEKFLPSEVKEFVSFNLNLAKTGKLHEIAAAFFFGRESLIPNMFIPMVKALENKQLPTTSLIYYLKRHIEVDGDEHGPMGQKFLEILCGEDSTKIQEALLVAQKSLLLRIELWNNIHSKIATNLSSR